MSNAVPKQIPNYLESGLSRYLTADQLAAIQRVKIGIGGAGGLGSNVAVILTRSGFKHFEIIDRDTVEPSNLNRQDYAPADIGLAKVDVLKKRILSLNPDAEVITHQAEWSPKNEESSFKNCDIIIEAFDRAEMKRDFVESYGKSGRMLVSGLGMAGISGNSVTSVKTLGNIYFVGDGATAIEDGHPPLAPRVVQCAAKMADVILQSVLRPSAT